MFSELLCAHHWCQTFRRNESHLRIVSFLLTADSMCRVMRIFFSRTKNIFTFFCHWLQKFQFKCDKTVLFISILDLSNSEIAMNPFDTIATRPPPFLFLTTLPPTQFHSSFIPFKQGDYLQNHSRFAVFRFFWSWKNWRLINLNFVLLEPSSSLTIVQEYDEIGS